ncbi:MAG: histidine kinase [Bacteroidetes bacterium]|nr:histidine kinase [Bacteroidota bacterium]
MEKLLKGIRATWDRKLVYIFAAVISLVGFAGRGLYFDTMPSNLNLYITFFSFIVLVSIWEVFSFLNRTLKKRFPLDKAPIPRVVIQIGLGTIFLFSLRALGIHLLGDYFPVEFNWAFRAAIYVVDFFLTACVNSLFFISEYIEKWKQGVQRADRLEKEKTQVQFDNLKNQLNPHFLFNALTSLNSLIKTDPKLASEFLQNMSRIYRYVLQHKDKDVVSLREEKDFVADYLFLMDTRFGEAFEFKEAIDERMMDKGIVPVTLQILIENALKHNTISLKKPLHLRLYTENNYLVMENNYQPKNRVEGSNKLGLENLKNLYSYLSDRPLDWQIEEGIFRIQIPLID